MKCIPGHVVPLATVPNRALVGVGHRWDVDVACLDGYSRRGLGDESERSDGEDEELRERDHYDGRRGFVKRRGEVVNGR